MRPNLASCLTATLCAALAACGTHGGIDNVTPSAPPMVDPHATPETRALFVNLYRLAGRQVMFGHQDDLVDGVTWHDEPGRSDVKEVAGSYPAVYGWDVGGIERGASPTLDRTSAGELRRLIVQTFERGGVNTISWHMSNPLTGGSAWDTTRALATLLPGGSHHARYVRWLDRFADFVSSLRAVGPSGDTVLVPVIFRPFHEMSGSWFWWGARHARAEDYRRLWRFTVEYLRDVRGVHNLLWAYSTNALSEFPRNAYWTWYPGDAYVDILGFDDYFTLQGGYDHTLRHPVARMTEYLRWLVQQADARGKIAALTETGYEGIPDPTWWTNKLLAAIEGDSVARKIAYVLVWRNANRATGGRGHFYAPYPGQVSARDFVRFRDDPLIVFEDDLPDLYRLPAGLGSRR